MNQNNVYNLPTSTVVIVTPTSQIEIGKRYGNDCYHPILTDREFNNKFNMKMCEVATNNKFHGPRLFRDSITVNNEIIHLIIYSPGAARGGVSYTVHQTSKRGTRVLYVSTKHSFNGHGHCPASMDINYIKKQMGEHLDIMEIDKSNPNLKWFLG